MPMRRSPVLPSSTQSQTEIGRDDVSRSFVPADRSLMPQHNWYLPLKACLDAVAALVLLVLTLPVILAAWLLVKLTSRGPAFYCQTRLGKNDRDFTLFKIRTMVHDAEATTGPVWAESDDPRTTAVGHFLRTTHIDELPQLLNVVLGQMSLVGPRPERPEIVAQLDFELPCYQDRRNVRPGITGLAQLKLPSDQDVECVRRKLVYDLYYVRHTNPWLDFRIILFSCGRLLKRFTAPLGRPFDLPSRDLVEHSLGSMTAKPLTVAEAASTESPDEFCPEDWPQASTTPGLSERGA